MLIYDGNPRYKPNLYHRFSSHDRFGALLSRGSPSLAHSHIPQIDEKIIIPTAVLWYIYVHTTFEFSMDRKIQTSLLNRSRNGHTQKYFLISVLIDCRGRMERHRFVWLVRNVRTAEIPSSDTVAGPLTSIEHRVKADDRIQSMDIPTAFAIHAIHRKRW